MTQLSKLSLKNIGYKFQFVAWFLFFHILFKNWDKLKEFLYHFFEVF